MIEQEATKHKVLCPQCHKRMRKTERNGVTAWILQIGSCNCSNTEIEPINGEAISLASSRPDDSDETEKPMPDCIAGRFEVLELLGKGGMGTVYKVRDKAVDRIISLKLLDESLTRDNTALKRFVQEAEAAAKLNHPNLVPVYGNGITDEGDAYLLMEYVPGESLAQVIEREGALEEDRAISIFLQICEALSYAHGKNILHRDIKPGNVILSKTDSGEEIARLVDFGIAKTLPTADRETRDLTQTGEVFGSPHYMSPEQCLGFMVDQRSDIYSFGCLVWETLSGKPPFSGSNPIQLIVNHINDPVKPFLGKFGGAPKIRSLQSIALRCLEKQQIDRFQNFDEIAELLESVSQGKRVSNSKVKKSNYTKQMIPVAFAVPAGIITVALMTPFLAFAPVDFFKGLGFIFLLAFMLPTILPVATLLGYFFECKKIVHIDMATRKHWWMTHSLLFSALIFGGVLPSIAQLILQLMQATMIIDLSLLPGIFKYLDVLAASGLLITALSSIASVICFFGYVFDRSPRNVKMSTVTSKVVLFTALATIGICTVLGQAISSAVAGISAGYASQPKEITSGFGLSSLAYLHKLYPDDHWINKEYAYAAFQNNEYKKAINLLSNLIDKLENKGKILDADDNDHLYDYLNKRASSYFEIHDYQNAIKDYNLLSERFPESSKFLIGSAEAYIELNQMDKALEDLNKVTELRPGMEEPYLIRAKLEVRNHEYDKAIDEYNKVISLESNKTAAAYALKAFAEEKSGKDVEAKKHYKAAFNPEYDYNYHTNLTRAILYLKMGQKDKAVSEYKKAKFKNNFSNDAQRFADLKIYPDVLIKPLFEIAPELK